MLHILEFKTEINAIADTLTGRIYRHILSITSNAPMTLVMYGTSNACNSKCSGNPNEICGGVNANSIYHIQFNVNPLTISYPEYFFFPS